MSQQALFDLERAAIAETSDVCLATETQTSGVSQTTDERRREALSALANKLQRATDPVDRAKLATEVRDLAEALVEESILDANRAGVTWRELGSGLGIPFQTLYRRYGATR